MLMGHIVNEISIMQKSLYLGEFTRKPLVEVIIFVYRSVDLCLTAVLRGKILSMHTKESMTEEQPS